jgi:hypothetical protein
MVATRLPPSINDSKVTKIGGTAVPNSTARPTSRSRLPHAGDPIRSSIDAIAVVSLVIQRPLEAETVAFFLDENSRSSTITVISGTSDPDSMLSIVECLTMVVVSSPSLCGFVLATVRPASPPNLPATQPGDVDRWIEANEIADSHGVELIEWFVVGPAGIDCPREMLGEPERW